MLASLGTHMSRTASRVLETAALTGGLQFTATAFGPIDWYRDEQPTLECPRCLGEITENGTPENDPRAIDDGYDSDSDPGEVDIDRLHYTGSSFFNNRTLRPGGSAHYGGPQADALRRLAPIMNRFQREGWESLPAVSGVAAGRSGPLRFDAVFADFMVDPSRGNDTILPQNVLAVMLRRPPGGGDAVYSQEALDRISSQLIPHSSRAPPPESKESIAKLGKRKVGIEDLGSDGKVECVICVEETPIEADSKNNRQGDQQQQSV
ncbi:hypothetical protein GE09DRAFT_1159312 [Coniochaeta sp. 2T2.1]|nr:hypothetical protein GE09DRAFT_1159312 [Coniochaeta sp. 2T2.1]